MGPWFVVRGPLLGGAMDKDINNNHGRCNSCNRRIATADEHRWVRMDER